MNRAHVLGLIAGVAFGFPLQEGRVLRFDKQVGAMLLRDMTIMKFMLSAAVVGMAGIYAAESAGMLALSHKPLNSGALVVGGKLFGTGWSIMGFCPGTSIGAIGEGRWHAGFAVLGMLVGAGLYAEIYPVCKSTVLAWKDFGKVGLPDTLGVPAGLVIVAFAACAVALFTWFERKQV